LRPLTPAPEYLNTPSHLMSIWLILLAYCGMCLLSAAMLLRRADNPLPLTPSPTPGRGK
jgi:hypothetical protein